MLVTECLEQIKAKMDKNEKLFTKCCYKCDELFK